MFRSRPGQTLIEYGALLALIALIVIVALLFLSPIVSRIFEPSDGPAEPAQQVQRNGQTYELVEPRVVVVDGYLYELVESPAASDE